MTQHVLCRHTGQPFDVRTDDVAFLENVSPVFCGTRHMIPPPTLCPAERERRRLAYRNERVFYHRKSALSGVSMLSFFHPDALFAVYTHGEWWSDCWDPLAFGVPFDGNRPFFAQFHDLQVRVPRPPLVNNNAVNSDYCNFADDNENCYLLTSANRNRDCYYGFLSVDNRSSVDCLWCTTSELMYECVDCRNCYSVHHARYCEDCSDGAFLFDCRGCRRCSLCIGLRHKENYILNRPCSAEEVDDFIAKMRGGGRALRDAQVQFDDLLRVHPIRRAINTVSCEDVTGDNLFQSQRVHLGFDVYESRDCAYLHDGLAAIDCQDVCFFDQTELCYESTSLMGRGYRFTMYCRNSSDLFYCDNCHGCRDCFGCVGMRNKQYCILNRQYSKEAYEQLASKIIEHMQKTPLRLPEGSSHLRPLGFAGQAAGCEWGEFFPVEMSLFAYNETLAQDYFPLTREEAARRGWRWREKGEEMPKVSNMIPAGKLPDSISDIPDDIVHWAIECEITRRPFKIIKQELEFYRTMQLPLPHLHPDERHRRRMNLRNPRRLWSRNCTKCGKAIETSYSPERPEIVYCPPLTFEVQHLG